MAKLVRGGWPVADNGDMLDPRILDNHELDAELAALRRGRDASMDEGAGDAALAETDLLIARFEEEIRTRHQNAVPDEIQRS
ncbi:hypothetical protein QMK17_07445 [Rhodococcus sp. G-MC3]|uniref:hypothetical protein n=1 Tax=Rhodococcus sp. G-MC3 TaxID=3046209 RepID=UPI0024B88D39|nr:hypothetical protein [Rhodococcus sp. G-MC3]MDJ0393164.1 hypothetical protein [Rhodococcus sp. G-MC3]